MVIFDKEKYIEDVKLNGIGATDPYASEKLKVIMRYYILNSKYKKGKIIEKVLEIARDYFKGLPDNIAQSELEELYHEIKKQTKETTEDEKKEIILYKSEMEIIRNLKENNLMKLAFAALILHKFEGQYTDGEKIQYYNFIKCNDSDIYRIAELNNVSGTTKNKLWRKLIELGLVEIKVKTNPAYRFNSSWIAFPVFSVVFNENLSKNKTELEQDVYAVISDYSDLMLYMRYYIGDDDLTLCENCRRPIKRNNGKKYCEKCSKDRKKLSDKKRYNKEKIRKSA